jgi:hypothetical protein
LGVCTLSKALEAIDEGRREEAKALVQLLWAEDQAVHDSFVGWLWALISLVGRRLGEEELFDALADTMDRGTFLTWMTHFGLEEFVHSWAEMMRAHGSGPGRLGNIVVKDEVGRYVIECDPCGTGGRMRREDVRTMAQGEEAHNHLYIKKAYPWTWGKTGVPAYCAHCSILEFLGAEQFGYPVIITDYPDDPEQPCRFIFYKDPDAIPEQYFTRLGKSKPAPGQVTHGSRSERQGRL